MNILLSAASALLALQTAPRTPEAAASPWVETRFHRIHLRNGNFIDGQLVQDTPKAVILQIRTSGNFVVRRDLIERVEFVKMRSLKEIPMAPVVETAAPAVPAAAATADAAEAPAPAGSAAAPDPVPSHFPQEAVKAVDALLTGYTLARPEQRRDLGAALGSMGPAAVSYACWIALHGRPGFETPVLIEAIGQAESPDVMPTLLNIASAAANSLDRAAAVKALARRPNPEARAALHRALGDPSGQVLRVASEELLKLHEKGQADVEALVALLKDREDKSVIAQTLGKMGGDVALAALRSLLAQGTAPEKAAAMRALGASGRAEDGEEAVEALEGNDETLRKEACLFLGKMKHGPAIPKLIAALKDEDESVGENALWSLRQITGQTYGLQPQRWQDWWEQNGRAKFAPATNP